MGCKGFKVIFVQILTNSSVQRVTWLCVIFWHHYEVRENVYRRGQSIKVTIWQWEPDTFEGKNICKAKANQPYELSLAWKSNFGIHQIVSAKSRSARGVCPEHIPWFRGTAKWSRQFCFWRAPAYSFIAKRITKSEKIVWNKIPIDLKLVKLIYRLYFPKDIFNVRKSSYRFLHFYWIFP